LFSQDEPSGGILRLAEKREWHSLVRVGILENG